MAAITLQYVFTFIWWYTNRGCCFKYSVYAVAFVCALFFRLQLWFLTNRTTRTYPPLWWHTYCGMAVLVALKTEIPGMFLEEIRWLCIYSIDCILSGVQHELVIICILLWPRSRLYFVCCCDTHFPSWGSIQSYLVLSYLIYRCMAGNTRQNFHGPKKPNKKQDDLSAFSPHFVQKAFNKTRTNDSISSAYKQIGSLTSCLVGWRK